MKLTACSRRFGALLLGLIGAFGAARVACADAGDPQLKWTPHRAAAAPAADMQSDVAPAAESPAVPQTTAAPPRLRSVPSAGAAAVQLPADVPPVDAIRSRAVAPAGPRPRTALPTQQQRPTLGASVADAVADIDVFRTPTRGAVRPILADESPAAPPRRGEVQRLGGGLAPRYSGRRPERPVANIDALPSVMRRAAQGQAAPDATEPGPVDAESIATPAPRDAGSLPDDGASEAIEFGDPAIAGDPTEMGGPDGLMLGDYPPQLHVESFYDDPYACEDDDPLCHHSGRICAWLRQFGRPYYGWRWYRDFTAGAGVGAFTNATDLGLNGNFGFDEFLNQGMPFWNAFGVGWQVGARGTQTDFQNSSLSLAGGQLERSSRQQLFVTTGFFTRAFEGRGLQGGAVYDYQYDNWFDTTDVAQLRYELSYVWGYHEFGFWGASNINDQISIFSPVRNNAGLASTLDLYTAFYRLQFGDANEWKVWGGATGYGDGIIGSVIRAPMARSWGLEGAATYVIPSNSQTVNLDGQGTTHKYSPAAWNVGVNLVFYPGGRSRRSLASPYRPLFDVADNGTLIRRLGVVAP